VRIGMPKRLDEVKTFMDRERLASFATVDSNNAPHVVPVFFTYDEGKVYIQTGRKSVKVRNLLRNNNVAMAVYRGEEAVIIRGKARIIDDEKEFIKRTQEHINKYRLKLDEQGRDSVGIPLFDTNVRSVIEVIPKRIIFW
jgi:nitroimidazol reductase NimA-like FMN-containing flavoprotein (pyridoxamine 5'-phosphate oxidase superfamily)